MHRNTSFNRRLALSAMAAIAATALAPAAWAQSAFPSRPITLVVTYPPGGGADAMARLIAPKMGEALGQSVVVDNKHPPAWCHRPDWQICCHPNSWFDRLR